MTSFHRNIAVTFGLVACTALGSASAQTVANGPYYAMPAWDQTLPASTRFVVLANMNSEAVLDRETGLVWWRSTSAPTTLESAALLCANGVGGRRGRVPTAGELVTLFDPTATVEPFFPAGHPFVGFATGQDYLWTSTPSFAEPTKYLAYGYLLAFGYRFYSINSDPNGARLKVLCVRAPG